MRILVIVATGILASANLLATWSVIAVDASSRLVAISSATCVRQASFARVPSKGLMDVQAIVVPGVGVAAAQAGVDRTRENQMLIFRKLQEGVDPAEIITMLKEDPQIDRRQFGILDLKGRMAGFSGSGNGASSLDRQGKVPGTQIYYSIQGNILVSDAVVEKAVETFKQAQGDLADRVLAAMTVADSEGGDRRCSCESEPVLEAPCTSKTAHVAYLLVAGPDDKNGESHNDGEYQFYLSATDADIQPDEDANPVKTLLMRYRKMR